MRFVSSTHAALATRVLTLPLMGLPPIEHICLFWTYTEAPSLHRRYPASSVLRASPPPHTARSVSREYQLIPTAITAGASRVASGLLCLHAVAITPAGSMKHVRSSLSIVGGLPCVTVRSAPAIVFSGPAQRSLALRPARSRSRHATLSTESSDSFVASAAASIATGWSEPVPGRELHPLKSSAFHGALLRQQSCKEPSLRRWQGGEACHDVSVLDQTGRIRVSSIKFYSPSYARRNYELLTGSCHRVIQSRTKTMDVT